MYKLIENKAWTKKTRMMRDQFQESSKDPH